MKKQYWIFVLTGLGVAIFDLIDSAFGNNLGIDSICVLSAFCIITWCMYVLTDVGRFAYEVRCKDVTECYILQVLASIIVSIFVILFYKKIPLLYKLTDYQYELFSKCLFLYGIFFVIISSSRFFKHYIGIQCRNKDLVAINILFYVLMIVLDALVLVFKGKCYHLVLTTCISFTVQLLYFIFVSKVFKDFKKPSLEIIKDCWLKAKDILIDRVVGKVATIVFNVCASHLGTELYALHSIGYNIATSSECITNEWYRMQVVTLHKIDGIKEKYSTYITLRNKMYLPSVLLSYALMLILIVPMHGETDLVSALIISSLYMTQSILLVVYENSRGFLSSVGETKSLRWGGFIGVIVRIPIAVISILTPIGIYGFAFGSGIDFLIRGLYYSRQVKKLVVK